MQLIVKKWGNRAYIRIPASIMEAMHLNLNDPVDMREENGRIIIEPLAHKTYEMDELLAAIKPDNLHAEVSTGTALGKEVLLDHFVPDNEIWFRQQVQTGLDSANAGHLVSASDVEARFAARRAATRQPPQI